MKRLFFLLVLSSAAVAPAQKMGVKIISRQIAGREWSAVSPAISLSNGTASANVYGTNRSASGYGTSSGSTVSVPAGTMGGTIYDIQLMLLLPDGRQIRAACNSRPHDAWSRGHQCKNPTSDQAEADFSGSKVKLRWQDGIDDKKKDSETFTILEVRTAGK